MANQDDYLTIHTDGASRGNPGPAAYAYVIESSNGETIERNEILPDTTNNIAEYTALVKALEHAQTLGSKRVKVYTDSELMVKQLDGSYRVKNEGLKPLFNQISALRKNFSAVEINHVPRAQNKRADALCNEALDSGKPKKTKSEKPKPTRAPAGSVANAHEEAIECLRSVAMVWAEGNPNFPKAEEVWDQLWNILQENGVVK